jgi:hypothetical protein
MLSNITAKNDTNEKSVDFNAVPGTPTKNDGTNPDGTPKGTIMTPGGRRSARIAKSSSARRKEE